MRAISILFAIAMAGCTPSLGDIPFPEKRPFFENRSSSTHTAMVASQYLNYSEYTHRAELRTLTGVDPVRTEWCAAFVNAVLRDSGIPGSESVSEHPLMARSFLDWGIEVEEPQTGDIIVFPRGNVSWQGHVGFYFGTKIIDGVEYYRILGGNQSNAVTIELYRADRAISIRRESSI